jgi:hypothetical protein
VPLYLDKAGGGGLTGLRVFFINPFVVIGPAIIIAFFYHNREKARFRSSLRKIDWGGMVLVSVSCVGILFGLLSGGVLAPWASAHVLVPLLLGALGVVAFGLYEGFVVERYTPAPALMPMRLFRHRTSATGYAATLLHSVCVALFANFFFIYVSLGLSTCHLLGRYVLTWYICSFMSHLYCPSLARPL